MGRWSHLDTDEERLPEGMVRIGYSEETGKYTFRDADGSLWESAPGCRYGRLTKLTDPSLGRTTPSTRARHDDVFGDDYDDEDQLPPYVEVFDAKSGPYDDEPYFDEKRQRTFDDRKKDYDHTNLDAWPWLRRDAAEKSKREEGLELKTQAQVMLQRGRSLTLKGAALAGSAVAQASEKLAQRMRNRSVSAPHKYHQLGDDGEKKKVG